MEEVRNDEVKREIMDFSLKGNIAKINYNEGNILKSIEDRNPHQDFKSTMAALVSVFAFHMELTKLSQSRITVIGIEKSSHKDFGICYRLTATVECCNCDYKLKTGNLIPKSEEFFTEEIRDDFGDYTYRDKEDYLWCIDEEETSLISNAFDEAMNFILGKRKPDEQGTFDFEGEEDGQDDFSDL